MRPCCEPFVWMRKPSARTAIGNRCANRRLRFQVSPNLLPRQACSRHRSTTLCKPLSKPQLSRRLARRPLRPRRAAVQCIGARWRAVPVRSVAPQCLPGLRFGHLAQRQAVSVIKPVSKIPLRQPAQLANGLSPDAAVNPHPTANNRAAGLAPGAASSPVSVSVAGALESTRAFVPASPETLPNALAAVPLRDFTASPATEITAPVKAASARATASKNVSHRQDKQRKVATSLHERSGRHSQTLIATALPHVSPLNAEAPRFAVPAIAQQTLPTPSAAGAYSLRAPSQLGADEYASTTLSAGTHLRDIAPPSRPASSLNPPGSSGTAWIDHMSQRRVTDVPNQFVK